MCKESGEVGVKCCGRGRCGEVGVEGTWNVDVQGKWRGRCEVLWKR